ncbi:MAG: hypothetical protein JWP74_1751 [Marmoricola sp.]|nr:hypothetical protein [Marmoricola sp.]
MSCGLVAEHVSATLRQGHEVVDLEGTWIKVGQVVVDGLAADVAAGTSALDGLPVTLTLTAVSVGELTHA